MLRHSCEHDQLVTPYDPALINPASIDLRLGNTIRLPRFFWTSKISKVWTIDEMVAAEPVPLWCDDVVRFTEHWLLPGEFVLCHSLEYIRVPPNATALLYCKSTTVRNGLEQSHGCLGDPGWGQDTEWGAQWTFEFSNVSPKPYKLIAGKPLMHMQLISMAEVPERLYPVTGRYNSQAGPTPPKS